MQLSSLLGHCQELLSIVRNSGSPADSLIDSFFRARKYLGSHDRRFIAETVYGTLRHFRFCEFQLNHVLTDNLPEEERSLLTVLAYLLGVEKKSNISKETVLGKLISRSPREVEELLSSLGKERTIHEVDPVQRIALRYSFPDWMVKKFLAQYTESEVEQLCKTLNEPAPLTLRVNTLKTTVEECQAALQKEGIETTRTRLSPFGLHITKRLNVFSLESFRNGWFEVQDEGSQLVPLIIDPKPTTKLLDACAGAGGKTLEFAALMKNRGEIFATDINSRRLAELRKRTKRAGAFNVRVKEVDSIDDLSENHREGFDIVFIDAPCTGIGTIRRNPGMKWTITEQTVKEVSAKQLSILQSAEPLVKPGGKLVYATCTMIRDENEDVVNTFLRLNPRFSAAHTHPIVEALRIDAMNPEPFIRFLPHLHGTDGYFCVSLLKSSS